MASIADTARCYFTQPASNTSLLFLLKYMMVEKLVRSTPINADKECTGAHIFT